MNKRRDYFPSLIEHFIIVCIIFVVIQTALEDISTILGWKGEILKYIAIAGFIFDSLFSLEFTARSIIASKRKEFKHYLLQERGWIDFLSSWPLLLLVSGPAMLILFMHTGSESISIGFLSILKTAKAVRVTRILRLIRIIKIFGKIQNSESLMTNRHIGIVATTSVVSLIVVLATASYIPNFRFGDHDEYVNKKTVELKNILSIKKSPSPSTEWLAEYIKTKDDVIYFKKISEGKMQMIYENPEKKDLMQYAYKNKEGSTDIPLVDGYIASISWHGADKEQSRLNILILFTILTIVFSYMVFYSRIFAQQVSDPIYIMDKGLRKMDYNLEVKINEAHKDEEIFLLADSFNRQWLPVKNRIRNSRKTTDEKSKLKMDDIF